MDDYGEWMALRCEKCGRIEQDGDWLELEKIIREEIERKP